MLEKIEGGRVARTEENGLQSQTRENQWGRRAGRRVRDTGLEGKGGADRETPRKDPRPYSAGMHKGCLSSRAGGERKEAKKSPSPGGTGCVGEGR